MARPLAGVRALEFGDSIAAAYAGKLLSDLGAEVERPARPAPGRDVPAPVQRYRRTLQAFLDEGKRIVNLPSVAGAGDHHFVITTQSLDALRADGLDPDRLADQGKILISITNFGLTEEQAVPLMPTLLAFAAGGFVLLTGETDRPPVANQVSLPQFQAGIFGVIGALAAWLGRGPANAGEVVDVSLYECVAFLMEREDLVYTHQDTVWTRSARHKVVHPFTILPCRDGHVALAMASPMMFRSLMELIEHPEVAEDEAIVLNTLANGDLIDSVLLPWLAEHDRREVAELCQQRRFPATPVLDFAELLADEHMKSRKFFRPFEAEGQQVLVPGMPYRFSEETAGARL